MQAVTDSIQNLIAVDFFVYLGAMGVVGLFLGSWIAEDDTPWVKVTVIMLLFMVLEQLAIRAVNPEQGHTIRATVANLLFFGIYFGCIAIGAAITVPFVRRKKIMEKKLADCLQLMRKGEISNDDFNRIIQDNSSNAPRSKPPSPC